MLEETVEPFALPTWIVTQETANGVGVYIPTIAVASHRHPATTSKKFQQPCVVVVANWKLVSCAVQNAPLAMNAINWLAKHALVSTQISVNATRRLVLTRP